MKAWIMRESYSEECKKENTVAAIIKEARDELK
jgi:hypothetical protein